MTAARTIARHLSALFVAAAGWGAPQPAPLSPPAPQACEHGDDRVNDDIRLDAKRDAARIANDNPGPYAGDIRKMQEGLDTYLAANPSPFYTRIIVIDPTEIDALTALGVENRAAVRAFVAKAGYDKINDANVKFLADNLSVKGVKPLDRLSAISPQSVNIPDDGTCVVLPVLPYALLSDANIPMPGFDIPATVEFFNRHEAWHCKDRTYDGRTVTRSALTKVDWTNMKTHLDKPEDWAGISILYKKEVLADVGALGEMVQAGQPPALIGAAASLRARLAGAGDIVHWSSFALAALSDRIHDKGVRAFRQLGAAEAELAYVGATESGGLSSAGAVHAFILQGYGSVAERARLEVSAEPAARHGVKMRQDYNNLLAPRAEAHGDPRLWAALQGLTPDKTRDRLEEKAFTGGGRITPETLLVAYNDMQAELRDRVAAAPGDLAAPVAAMHLRAVFQSLVREEDFVVANRLRGLDIRAKRACAPPPG